VDDSSRAYVAGETTSAGFPTTPGAFDETFNGGSDAFVTKLDEAGAALVYSTFVGGSSSDSGQGEGMAVSAAGHVFLTATTTSADFPVTPGAFDTTFNGGTDAYVTKLNRAGSALAYSTFLGGRGSDRTNALAVDGAGSAYVTGQTYSADFPTTPGSFDPECPGTIETFLTKLNAAGSELSYSTCLAADNAKDEGLGVAVDRSGHATLTGWARGKFPTTPDAFDRKNDTWDAFVARLDGLGSTLVYSTFLGGRGEESGHAVAVDRRGDVYATGITWAEDFPTTRGAFDRTFNGDGDSYVTKLRLGG
jgi:hypothetical protein